MERALASRLLLLLGTSVVLGASAQPVYDDDYFIDNGAGDDSGDDDGSGGTDDRSTATIFTATLHGFQEVPAISTTGRGTFRAEIDDASSMITYTLSYDGLEAAVQQAHIHVGQILTNGGVSAFLCSNLEEAPPNVQACPEPPAEITGTIMAEQVVGPADQGIAAGEFEELVAAIRAHVTYANVHTETFPAGEIRGQLIAPRDDDDDDDDGDDDGADD
ncbi:MAG: CHRD domain-containing protein [Gammaproteobacteria bacterium]|nr:CHRD domain-containing protein [Gammaproteobacteria bacterium]